MDQLLITGGKPLFGTVKISGAKNAVLPIICASLLTHEELTISNVPNLRDVRTMTKILQELGVQVTQNRPTFAPDELEIKIAAHSQITTSVPYELVKTMRASILFLGPLLARYGEAKVSLPGGCAIGSRPVEQHLKGLEAMGATILLENGYIHAFAPEKTVRGLTTRRLKGARIVMDMVTVTGTENLIMAATLADGETILENAAKEPEVVDLCLALQKMGAKIQGIGSDKLIITGVDSLKTAKHRVQPDRIEAGTFLCAVAATGGDIILTHVVAKDMDATLAKVMEAGVQLIIDEEKNTIQAIMPLDKTPKAVSIRTSPYPGLATDMQAQIMAMNILAQGTSTIIETIFENRMMHVPELQRLGAHIQVQGNTAIVTGVEKSTLKGAPVMATDLRASAGLVIAGLVSEGKTIIDRIYHLDRGYDHLEEKLTKLGADIQRIHGNSQE